MNYKSGKTGVAHALLFAGTEEGGVSSTKSSEIYLHLHKHGRVKMLLISVKSGTGRISRNSALVVRWYRHWRHVCAFFVRQFKPFANRWTVLWLEIQMELMEAAMSVRMAV